MTVFDMVEGTEVNRVGLEEEVGTGCLQGPDTVAGCWMLDFGRPLHRDWQILGVGFGGSCLAGFDGSEGRRMLLLGRQGCLHHLQCCWPHDCGHLA